MGKMIIAVLALAALAFGQKAASITAVSSKGSDTLIAAKQITVPQTVVHPNKRFVLDSVWVGDSIRHMIYRNGKEVFKYEVTKKREPLDTANVTKCVTTIVYDDFSK